MLTLFCGRQLFYAWCTYFFFLWLCFLTEITLRTVGTVVRNTDSTILFYYSSVSLYRSRRLTVDVQLVYAAFWLPRSGNCSLGLIKRGELDLFVRTSGQVFIIYCFWPTIPLFTEFCPIFDYLFGWIVTEAHCQRYDRVCTYIFTR